MSLFTAGPGSVAWYHQGRVDKVINKPTLSVIAYCQKKDELLLMTVANDCC